MKYYIRIEGQEFVVSLDHERQEIRVEGPEGSPAAGGITVTLESDGGFDKAPRSNGEAVRVSATVDPSDDRPRVASAREFPGSTDSGSLRLLVNQTPVTVQIESPRDRLARRTTTAVSRPGPTTVRSLLPGVVRRVLRAPGDVVDTLTPILTIEAMKMENEVRAEAVGRIRAILVTEGQVVRAGETLVELEASD